METQSEDRKAFMIWWDREIAFSISHLSVEMYKLVYDKALDAWLNGAYVATKRCSNEK